MLLRSVPLICAIWNAVCFWLGVLDVCLIFDDVLQNWELHRVWAWLIAIAVVDGLLGYIFAYTFYFVFIAYGEPRWMNWGVGLLSLYVIGTAWLTYEAVGHVQVVEAAINGAKAVANAACLYHGVQIACAGAHLGAGRVRLSRVGTTHNMV